MWASPNRSESRELKAGKSPQDHRLDGRHLGEERSTDIPPTCVRGFAIRRIAPIRLVVVVLPLLPVTPMMEPRQSRMNRFISVSIGTPVRGRR